MAATRARNSATWLSTSCTACRRFQRRLNASASIAYAAAVAARRSAVAMSTEARFSATATRYGSLSNSASRSPLRARLLSSTRTREICPATPGATNVTCPFTNASSVETVLNISSTRGMPSTRTTASTATPTAPASSFRLRLASRGAGFRSGASVEAGLSIGSVTAGTRRGRRKRNAWTWR